MCWGSASSTYILDTYPQYSAYFGFDFNGNQSHYTQEHQVYAIELETIEAKTYLALLIGLYRGDDNGMPCTRLGQCGQNGEFSYNIKPQIYVVKNVNLATSLHVIYVLVVVACLIYQNIFDKYTRDISSIQVATSYY